MYPLPCTTWYSFLRAAAQYGCAEREGICAAAGAAGLVVARERAVTAELCKDQCCFTSKVDAQQGGWTGGHGVLALHVSCYVLCSFKAGVTTQLLCQGDCVQFVCFMGFL